MKSTTKLIDGSGGLTINPKTLMLFCIFIYFPTFKFSQTASYLIEYGIPLFYIIANYQIVKKISKKTIYLLSLSILIILLSVITPIVHRTGDYSYIMTSTYIVRRIIVYAFLSLLLIKQHQEKTNIKHFTYYFALATTIYVLGTILLVMLPGIKEFWFSIFSISEKSEKLLQSYGYTFRIGWIGFSGFRLTIRCAFCSILLMYLYFSKAKIINKSQFYIPYLICLLGTMFYGRSGLVVATISSSILLVALNVHQIKRIMEFAIILVAMLLTLFTFRNVPVIQKWYNWVTKPFVNLATKGSFDNYSFDNTNRMVYLPDTKTIVFGDGYYMQDGYYYQKTDSGIMRNVLFWGIAGVILSYGAMLYSIIDIRKISKPLFYSILIAVAIFEYKGEIYYEVLPFATMIPLITDITDSLTNQEHRIKITGEKQHGKHSHTKLQRQ